jgi:arylsulfatase A
MQQSSISRRTFLLSSALGAAGAAFGVSVPRVAASTGRKNIICILCDDMGAEELACYGNTAHQTPNLDALAAAGTRFETFYASPVCSPTRVCLMTGRYGFRTGWCNMRGRSAGSPPRDTVDLARDERNFANCLRMRAMPRGSPGNGNSRGTT